MKSHHPYLNSFAKLFNTMKANLKVQTIMENQSLPTKLISECYIKPVHEPEETTKPLYLTPSQISFLGLHPIQKGLLFTKPGSFELGPFLDQLKRSISIALVHFYPLAGQFVDVTCSEEKSCWIYLDCNKGPGVWFVHAVCSVTVEDVVLYQPDLVPVVRSFFEMGEEDIINVDGCTRALLSVQVTELIDGIFIGFTMNHSLADGSSFWHFINTLSEIFGYLNNTNNNMNNDQITNIQIISRPPIFTPIFPDGYGPIIKLPDPTIHQFANKYRSPKQSHINLMEKIFHFSSSSIAKLKAKANAECDGKILNNRISSFQSVCALLWRCIARARCLGPDDRTVIMIVASSRTRTNPPLPENHFGNLVVPINKSYNVGELLENGLGFAAMSIHETIAALDDEAYRGLCKGMLDYMLVRRELADPPPWAGNQNPVIVGGSARFDNYGPEFGLGKAVALRTGHAAKTDGKVTVSQGLEGGGSMELEISLAIEAMCALEKDQEFMSFVSSNKY